MPVVQQVISDGRTLACEAPTMEMAQEGLRYSVEHEERKLRFGTDDPVVASLAACYGSIDAAKAAMAEMGMDFPPCPPASEPR